MFKGKDETAGLTTRARAVCDMLLHSAAELQPGSGRRCSNSLREVLETRIG